MICYFAITRSGSQPIIYKTQYDTRIYQSRNSNIYLTMLHCVILYFLIWIVFLCAYAVCFLFLEKTLTNHMACQVDILLLFLFSFNEDLHDKEILLVRFEMFSDNHIAFRKWSVIKVTICLSHLVFKSQ